MRCQQCIINTQLMIMSVIDAEVQAPRRFLLRPKAIFGRVYATTFTNRMRRNGTYGIFVSLLNHMFALVRSSDNELKSSIACNFQKSAVGKNIEKIHGAGMKHAVVQTLQILSLILNSLCLIYWHATPTEEHQHKNSQKMSFYEFPDTELWCLHSKEIHSSGFFAPTKSKLSM